MSFTGCPEPRKITSLEEWDKVAEGIHVNGHVARTTPNQCEEGKTILLLVSDDYPEWVLWLPEDTETLMGTCDPRACLRNTKGDVLYRNDFLDVKDTKDTEKKDSKLDEFYHLIGDMSDSELDEAFSAIRTESENRERVKKFNADAAELVEAYQKFKKQHPLAELLFTADAMTHTKVETVSNYTLSVWGRESEMA